MAHVELKVLEQHIDLAAKHGQMILVHTPHLEDKRKGTRLILDALKADARIQPGRVIIDHVEEHTIRPVLDEGFWAGMTLYPISKCTPARAVDMVEEVEVAGAQVVETGFTIGREGEAVLRALAVAGEQRGAFAALAGERVALGIAERSLLGLRDQLDHLGVHDVAEQVRRLDEVVARVEIAVVLEGKGVAAGLAEDAQARTDTEP